MMRAIVQLVMPVAAALAVVSAATAAAAAAAGPKPPPPPPLRMTVALYSPPGKPWERMAAAAKAHPSVKMTALISPNHDFNDTPFAGDDIEKYIAHNQTWLDGLQELRGAGVRIQHYFHMRNLSCGAESKCGLPGLACRDPAGVCVPKYRCCNSVANVSAIVNASLTYWPADG